MTTLLIGMIVAGLFMALVAVAACVVSGNVSDHERRIEALRALGWAEWSSANCDYAASDDAGGNEADNG